MLVRYSQGADFVPVGHGFPDLIFHSLTFSCVLYELHLHLHSGLNQAKFRTSTRGREPGKEGRREGAQQGGSECSKAHLSQVKIVVFVGKFGEFPR